ncbi:3-mercaptopyruvate sulfurtransferase [Devosia rhodophyticola]|uniref:Sulfurtransferase n=1 Tax=Devosia rhodophyticola TaxID=3026423 RepID=A0ABY7YYY9_9HYPH|nr:3-mercaptopyruvate sulfurtransferase [Devosia rhodophyticola]WDR06466.1 3-mercaptopyruvate sulfurtransferase [Devosia rhodophyticola]
MHHSPLISVQDAAALIDQPGTVFIDASWHMPAEKRDPHAEYLAGHIPGAVFFDIDAIADQTSGLPHTLASEEAFGAAVSALGVNQANTIIVYDSAGLFSAARVWWNFRVAGASDVRVLNGGLPAWRALGLPISSGTEAKEPGQFTAQYNQDLVRSFEQMLKTVQNGDAQVVDARGGARFRGEVVEPRAGLKSGHIVGSRSVPFTDLLSDGKLGPAAELKAIFENTGVNLTRPIVTSCGSGVTAAVLALALAVIGRDDVSIYDGSWSEWGGRMESSGLIATGE